jgi:hypothetical protein
MLSPEDIINILLFLVLMGLLSFFLWYWNNNNKDENKNKKDF